MEPAKILPFPEITESLAMECFTTAEYEALCNHLHNGNAPLDCGIAFVSKEKRKPVFVKAKRKTAQALISWNRSTVWGKGKNKIAYIPFSANKAGSSRWGAFDFDAHDGDWARAMTLARRGLKAARNEPDLFLILEQSGQGYHLWLISRQFQKVKWWIRKLKTIAREIEAPIMSGICEIFPSDQRLNKCGNGLRAPGSWNPKTGRLNQILSADIDPLLEDLLTGEAAASPAEREDFFSFYHESEAALKVVGPVLEKFKILKPQTRNEKLIGLTSSLFPIVCRDLAANAARLQFLQKEAKTKAKLEDHLKSFEKHWRNMLASWISRINSDEKKAFEELQSDSHREAFKIFWNFNQLAQTAHFSISVTSLGSRLGITPQAAGQLRARFCQLGILKKVRNSIPNKRSAQFVWLLSSDPKLLNRPFSFIL
jgi:hypothetical protein